MTRNKSEDTQYSLARRIAPAVFLAGGGVAFLAAVDGSQVELALEASVPPTTTSTSTTTGSTVIEVCGVQRSTGAQVQFRWGIIQVEALFDGAGSLCEVNTLQFPDEDRRSVSINNFALPILRQQALDTDSSAVQAISGATLTSRAYMASLQYALDNR